MSTPLETAGMKQAVWRTDPNKAGASFTMGDIGTHCANLLEYVSGLKISRLYAKLHTFVKGRKLDDDGSVLLELDNGAHGLLWASGIAAGEENGLNIRVYGEKGSLKWRQEEPNTLEVRWLDKPKQIIRTGATPASGAAAKNTRLPAGHPEGFIEGFANIYNNFADALEKQLSGGKLGSQKYDFPGVDEGVRGMSFIEGVVKSSKTNRWIKI
jgi:predicted dehydrogenase